ncbi:diacylglycerol kinase [Falsihalocynthiibacter arcticus]|uniref:Diacylglycerol kinase n=1 Tax=Falsihalocynthiibacter arcticus TaxID=1579316 RepID=A0A126UWB7_9RHOB|nr:diacylglycerol kinase [Falsihalocynthiibacter arcticus]AML50035.1 diacylglycerol kinase [Falsihalocynthiibacter arcticus]
MIVEQWKRFSDRAKWSWEGWRMIWREEASLQQWVWANAASFTLAMVLDLSTAERALIVALGILVLAAECYNTAIERCIDYLSPAYHPLAKAAKDAGSAGVTITAIAAGGAWVIILIG